MNDELELADGFYSISNIQDYIEYIIKKERKYYPLILLFIFRSSGLIIGSK